MRITDTENIRESVGCLETIWSINDFREWNPNESLNNIKECRLKTIEVCAKFVTEYGHGRTVSKRIEILYSDIWLYRSIYLDSILEMYELRGHQQYSKKTCCGIVFEYIRKHCGVITKNGLVLNSVYDVKIDTEI